MIGSIGNRGEKLPTVKLAAVQYFILIIMLVLAAQLWRLQVVGAEYFRAEPHPQGADHGSARQAV
jgi:penicillin-binding protein 2